MDRAWDFESLRIKKLDPKAQVPRRAHPDDAGLDLTSVEEVELAPGAGTRIRTGLAFAIPSGFVGLVADRSSLASKGLKTAGGVIDAGYRGEVQVVIWNLSSEPRKLAAGDRIAQLLVLPVATPPALEVQDLEDTGRGAGGFGSTGR